MGYPPVKENYRYYTNTLLDLRDLNTDYMICGAFSKLCVSWSININSSTFFLSSEVTEKKIKLVGNKSVLLFIGSSQYFEVH